jgi:GntR family transcriptional regulator
MMERIFAADAFDDAGAGPLYLQLQRRYRGGAWPRARLPPATACPPNATSASMTGL